jgi:hypothetical protein
LIGRAATDLPPDWTNDIPPVEAYEADGRIEFELAPLVPPAQSTEKSPAHAGPATPPASAVPVRATETAEFKRTDQPNGRVGQILGIERFDAELEAWLTDRGWSVKLNRLSGELEIHLASGVVPMTDERLAEIRFTVAYASNGRTLQKTRSRTPLR